MGEVVYCLQKLTCHVGQTAENGATSRAGERWNTVGVHGTAECHISKSALEK